LNFEISRFVFEYGVLDIVYQYFKRPTQQRGGLYKRIKNQFYLTMKTTFILSIITFFSLAAFAQNEKTNLQRKLESMYSTENFSATKLLYVSAEYQRLYMVNTSEKVWYVEEFYTISTATKGLGTQAGSDKTPTGLHSVAKKIGAGEPKGTIFKARKPAGVAKIFTDKTDSPEDFVTSRILWLKGAEFVNTREGHSSYHRYVYIHGTNEEGLLGRPASHGCIRMKNEDVISLFSKVPIGTFVYINDINLVQ